MTERRAIRPGEVLEPRIERRDSLVIIRSLSAGRQVLRARNETTQAGFTAEYIPRGPLKHHPILISDGPQHDEQRKKVARFFAPAVVEQRYGQLMKTSAARLLTEAETSGECLLDDVALEYSVEVTAQAVGLTESNIPAMAKRLVTFFNQPPFDLTKPRLGRSRRQWASAARRGLVPIVRFYVSDVRPAIKIRRARGVAGQESADIISHLIAEGYNNADILVECVTYGTAGMVTTREFIAMAAWHLFDRTKLRERYLVADEPERMAILAELMRLEPVVGHFYRRVQHAFDITDSGETWRLQPGDLVDIQVRPAHLDSQAVGADPDKLCPGRQLPPGVGGVGLAFGDGAHKCPGQPLAMREADVFLRELFARRPIIVKEPTIGWDDLIAGYALRGFKIRFPDGVTNAVKPSGDIED